MTDLGSQDRIQLANPDISDDEMELVVQVLRSGTLALGPMAERFEAALAAVAGRAHAVACSSGTAGLHMAVNALGIGPGSEVITTPFSFIASANCVVYEGARPRFVDIEETTLGLDPALVEDAASPATAAILPVHVFGHPCQIEDIAFLARSRGWHLIEDSCEAIGCSSRGRPLGSFGQASVFAFYPNKQITTGEGGAVLVDDAALADTIRSLRNQGRDEDGTWLRHVRLGFNYRMDEMSAALGLAQLERLTDMRAGRQRTALRYRERLERYEWVSLPVAAEDANVDWFVFVVRLDGAIDRDRLIRQLDAEGVPARPYFSPLHLQPVYQRMLGHRAGDFPVTEKVAASTLALPYSATMSHEAIDQVADVLVRCVERQLVSRNRRH